MKTKLLKTITLALCTGVFSLTANAQLPDFMLVDTGAIYELRANKHNGSGNVFDADNDGDLDPVIGGAYIDLSLLMLYKNEREGLYKPDVLLPEISNAFNILLTSPTGDIDNDGDIDVVGQKYQSAQLGVFINNGYGNFASDTIYYMPSTPYSPYPVLLDFNGDGYLDLIRFDTAVVILYNNGKGVFENKTKIGHYGKNNNVIQHSLSWADADNDGDMDVYCGMTFHKNIFFLNTGTALEQIEEDNIILSEDEATHCVNWIDYDNDGDMDLFTVDVLFENLGSMEFEKHIIIDEKYDSDSVWSSSRVWGDLDNDGDLDLFVSVENNHLLGDPDEPISAHPYNLLYLNEGNGQFTNVFNHTLTLHDGHTADIFDHDNDGDLDVLSFGNGWAKNGHNQLFINEGNENSSILVNCIDKYGCSTPFGTRIYAKTMIEGKYVSQMREITPVDGNFSFGNTRMHFGLGDAEVVDTMLIRWPSGHVDTYLDVAANQFYRAIEDDNLEIDFKATNYIEYSPSLPDVKFTKIEESTTIDLKEYYRLMTRDTVPEITGDTLTFSVYANENPAAVNTTFEGTLLTLEAGQEKGDSKVQIKASAGFTERVDHFTVKREFVDVITYTAAKDLNVHPNPFTTSTTIKYTLNQPETVIITFYNQFGEQVDRIEQKQSSGLQQVIWTPKNLSDGIYYFKLEAGEEIASGKVVLMR